MNPRYKSVAGVLNTVEAPERTLSFSDAARIRFFMRLGLIALGPLLAVMGAGSRINGQDASAVVTTATVVRTGAGILHTVTIAQQDAAPTAGTIQIRDAAAAGGGTVLFEWVLTTAVFYPFSVVLDVRFTTGLVIDFTTTADVNVVCSYLAEPV